MKTRINMLQSVIGFAALVAAYANTVSAESGNGLGGYLHVPVHRRASRESELLALYRRATDSDDDGQLDLDLDNVNNSYYTIEFELGTPAQKIALDLDTGSSDLWVYEEDACVADYCDENSLFHADESSTFKTNRTEFIEVYGDGTGAIGWWAQDVMHLGDTEIKNLNFAVANRTTSGQGVAGIGLPQVETPYVLGEIETPYLNLPQQLKAEGAIHQAAYSLWLNQKDAEAGSILFGALDHAKYNSDLYVLPLVQSTNRSGVTDLAVKLTGLSAFNSDGDEQPFVSCALPAVLDSGTTTTRLPLPILEPLLTALVAEHYDEGYFLVDCDKLTEGGVGLQIGGVDITLSFSDVSRPFLRSRRTGTTYCVPGFIASDDNIAIIGDNILRHLYVVYDLENLEVGIAAAETGSAASQSSIQVLSTGIPGKTADTNTDLALRYAKTSVTVLDSSSEGTSSSYVSTDSDFFASSSTSADFQTGSGAASFISVPKTVTESFIIGANAAAHGNFQPTSTSSGSSSSSFVRSASADKRSSSAAPSSTTSKDATAGGAAGVVANSASESQTPSRATESKPNSASVTTADKGGSKSASSASQGSSAVSQRSSKASSDGAVLAVGSLMTALSSVLLWLL